MKKINEVIKKIDNLAPNPWIIDGHKQASMSVQLSMMLGVIIVFILILLFG